MVEAEAVVRVALRRDDDGNEVGRLAEVADEGKDAVFLDKSLRLILPVLLNLADEACPPTYNPLKGPYPYPHSCPFP